LERPVIKVINNNTYIALLYHTMKLHRNLATGIITGLNEVILQQKQADVTVERVLQSNKSWGARDRHFIADNIYTIIRYKRLYEFCAEIEGVDVPALWKLLGTKLLVENWIIPDWAEFAELKLGDILQRKDEAQNIRKIRESIPDWLDETGEKELGGQWDAEISALNKTPALCLRVNELKTSRQQVQDILQLAAIGCRVVESAPDALLLEARTNIRNLPAYKQGMFEIQDAASQMVAPFTEVKPGITVIDGCAGAGGKTLHLAALMNNTGKIFAVDVNENKLAQLQIRARRAGCSIISTYISDNFFSQHQNEAAFADVILLDAPCSGLGVLRRKADAKWILTPQFLEEIKVTQAQLLKQYAPLLKTGGLLVYSTCSILPSENEQQIKIFLEANRNFEFISEQKISPAETGFDGFYMAKLVRLK
jgi:16S rRNA (cytosine967-C5)-methyltransferase